MKRVSQRTLPAEVAASPALDKLPITVLIAAKNEEANLKKCLEALAYAERLVLLDSGSSDRSCVIAQESGAEVVQFEYRGGYPKKRQWALDTLEIRTPWVLLVDADEVVPAALWKEMAAAVRDSDSPDAFLITKGFHFMGRRFRFGGFSFGAVLLFRTGKARFERLLNDEAGGLDMEVHERVIVDGRIGRLRTPLIHEDFKGLDAYLERHRRYARWESRLRFQFLTMGTYGQDTIQPNLFGNTQERRRFLKAIAIRMPFEPFLWFVYHYFFRLGFLEGYPGYMASRIRSRYIGWVRENLRALRSART